MWRYDHSATEVDPNKERKRYPGLPATLDGAPWRDRSTRMPKAVRPAVRAPVAWFVPVAAIDPATPRSALSRVLLLTHDALV
jgi:hypothetical protein